MSIQILCKFIMIPSLSENILHKSEPVGYKFSKSYQHDFISERSESGLSYIIRCLSFSLPFVVPFKFQKSRPLVALIFAAWLFWNLLGPAL